MSANELYRVIYAETHMAADEISVLPDRDWDADKIENVWRHLSCASNAALILKNRLRGEREPKKGD